MYCPNCNALLPRIGPAPKVCWNCDASFEAGSAWRPTARPTGPFREVAKELRPSTERLQEAEQPSRTIQEPVHIKIRRQKFSTPAVFFLIGTGSILIPTVAFIVGMTLMYLIPGCQCDEGAGCHGCGANGLVSFLMFGGFVGALFSLITILPISYLLALVFSVVTFIKKDKHND